MTPEDRALARDLLIQNRLTIEQVTELQKECDATGRGFRDVALAKGLLKPEKAAPAPAPAPPRPTGPRQSLGESGPIPPLFQRLLVATLGLLVLLIIIGILQYNKRSARDQQLAEESIRAMADADRRAKDVRIAYEREQLQKQEKEFLAALAKARDLMKAAEERVKTAPGDPQLYLQLVEATNQFTVYLAGRDTDAAVYVERSRAYELRRDFERALKDVDRAIQLDKELAPKLDPRLNELRLQVARPKK